MNLPNLRDAQIIGCIQFAEFLKEKFVLSLTEDQIKALSCEFVDKLMSGVDKQSIAQMFMKYGIDLQSGGAYTGDKGPTMGMSY